MSFSLDYHHHHHRYQFCISKEAKAQLYNLIKVIFYVICVFGIKSKKFNSIFNSLKMKNDENKIKKKLQNFIEDVKSSNKISL